MNQFGDGHSMLSLALVLTTKLYSKKSNKRTLKKLNYNKKLPTRTYTLDPCKGRAARGQGLKCY